MRPDEDTPGMNLMATRTERQCYLCTRPTPVLAVSTRGVDDNPGVAAWHTPLCLYCVRYHGWRLAFIPTTAPAAAPTAPAAPVAVADKAGREDSKEESTWEL